MNEYWLMLFFVGLGVALALAFFRHLAKLAIWSSRPILDAWRYSLITVCLAIEIGNAFEVWEAALLGAVSLVAYRVIRQERSRFESAIQKITARAHTLSDERGTGHHFGL